MRKNMQDILRRIRRLEIIALEWTRKLGDAATPEMRRLADEIERQIAAENRVKEMVTKLQTTTPQPPAPPAKE
jgi:hypothetical protein